LFGRELEEGVVSVQQLGALRTGVAKAGIGIQAFAGDIFGQMGGEGPLKDLLNQMESPLGRGMVVRRIAEGGAIAGPEGWIEKPAGGWSVEQADILKKQQAALTAEVFKYVEGLAGDGPPGATSQEQKLIQNFKAQTMLEGMGLIPNATVEAAKLLREAAVMEKEATEGFMGAQRPFLSAAEAFAAGAKLFGENLTIQDRLLIKWEQVWDQIAYGFIVLINALSPGEPLGGLEKSMRDRFDEGIRADFAKGIKPSAAIYPLDRIEKIGREEYPSLAKEFGMVVDVMSETGRAREYSQEQAAMQPEGGTGLVGAGVKWGILKIIDATSGGIDVEQAEFVGPPEPAAAAAIPRGHFSMGKE
jgi:hypothetical protein